MSFSIEITLEAELDIEKFKKSGDKKSLVKIDKLLNGATGTPNYWNWKTRKIKVL